MSSNIVIDIAAQFTGKKAFNQTEKSIDRLGRSLKKALIGGSLLALTNQAIKAFAEEEKSAKLLANTLENLGFGMATKSVEAFISQLQLATGVSDSELRPAMAKLVQTLGSVTAAQDALSLAMDVSAASGISLDTVVSDLAAAQMGNYKGLKKYALGLTQLQLKTMSATEIMARFNDIFGGGAAVAADTFAGKLARINVAIDEAKESLGKGIIDALMVATGSKDIEALQQKIIDFGTKAGEAVRNLGKVFKDFLPVIKTVGIAFAALWSLGKIQAGVTATIKILSGVTKAMKALRVVALTTAIAQAFVLNPLGGVAVAAGIIGIIAAVGVALDDLDTKWTALGKKSTDFFGQTDGMKFGERFDLTKYKAAQAEAKKQAALDKKNADALKRAEAKAAADRAKLAKQELAAKQKADKLAKAASKFDMDKIQIAAALKGKISEEEKTRLLLMQAIANEDADKAEALSKKLEEIQKKNEEIAKSLLEIQDAKDPFAEWVKSLTAAASLLGQMPGLIDSSGALTPRGKKTIPQDPTDPIDVEIVDPKGTGNGGNNDGGTFTGSETIDEILEKVGNAAEEAAAAATAAAESVAETQTAVDQLAEAALNGAPATGSSSIYSGNPYSAVGGAGYGTPYPPSNVYINVEGSMLSSDEYVKAVTQALVEGTTNGYNTYRPGAVLP